MNFLILGCSWGVPGYDEVSGLISNVHTSSELQKAGHTVDICAINGGSNLTSLNRAKSFLAGEEIEHPSWPHIKISSNNINKNYDWVIWFQTEFIRDEKSVPYSTNLIEDIARLTYTNYQDFFKTIGSKVALIGANSDLHPCYTEYFNPDFVVQSWTSTIIHEDTIKFNINDPELNFKFIDNELRLQNLKRKCKRVFPDGSHPGPGAHVELVKKLLECATNLNLQNS